MQFTEKIERMQATIDATFGKIVTEMTYVLTGDNGSQQDICMRRIVLDAPTSDNFIQFGSLSEGDVLAWAVQKLGEQEINAMKNGMQSKMENQSIIASFPVNAPWVEI